MNAEIAKDLRTNAVVAQIRGKPKFFVGFNGVKTTLLQAVGLELVDQSDSAAFLAQIHHDPFPFRFDVLEGAVQLRTAVASQRAERIAGQAFGMHAHQHRFAQIAGVPFDQRHMLTAIELIAVTDGLKRPKFSGQGALGRTHHEAFVVQPVADQVFNAD